MQDTDDREREGEGERTRDTGINVVALSHYNNRHSGQKRYKTVISKWQKGGRGSG